MFLFNTTFVVSESKLAEWKTWLNNVYKPLLISVVPNAEISVYEVMVEDKKDGISISAQWKVGHPEELEGINKHGALVLEQMSSEFGSEVLYFSTILKQF